MIIKLAPCLLFAVLIYFLSVVQWKQLLGMLRNLFQFQPERKEKIKSVRKCFFLHSNVHFSLSFSCISVFHIYLLLLIFIFIVYVLFFFHYFFPVSFLFPIFFDSFYRLLTLHFLSSLFSFLSSLSHLISFLILPLLIPFLLSCIPRVFYVSSLAHRKCQRYISWTLYSLIKLSYDLK